MKNQKRLVELGQKEQPAEKEEEELKPSDKFGKFSKILDDSKQVIEKDILKAKKLYIKARNLYIELETEEKKEVYSELTGLYNKLIRLAKEEELKRKKLLKERKEKLIGFLHKAGGYKTPEEKKQIILQKEQERQEKFRKEAELKQQRELEKQKEERRRKELDQDRRKLEELKKKPTLFGKLFKAKEQLIKTQAEKKPKEQKESEFEELEEAIRNLGLFKKIEKEKAGIKEKPKEKLNIFGKLFKK